MKLRILIIFILCFSLSPFVLSAKEKPFGLAQQKSFKPKNQKILKVLWSRSLKAGNSKKRYYPETNSPTLYDGSLYVGTYGGIFYAVNEQNGKFVWEYKHGSPISSSAAVMGENVVFSDVYGHLICLNRSSGALVWKQYVGKSMLARPLILGNSVYIIAGEREVIALSLADGHTLFSRNMPGFIRRMTMHGQGAIVSDAGRLYVGLADGALYSLFPSDGKVLWEKSLTIPLQSFKDVDGTIVLDGDAIFATGYSGATFKLNRATGATVWQSDVGSGVTPLVLSDQVVVSTTEDRLVSNSKSDGKVRWLNELNHSVLTAPVFVSGFIFVATTAGEAFLVDPTTGDQLQKIDLAAGTISEPTSAGNKVYILSGGANLIALGPVN